ncbi:MAG: pentapeptide repeat-containing protein [Bacteroidota bacterium]
MKGNAKLLTGLALGGLLIGALALWGLPLLAQQTNFLLGFIAGGGFVLSVLALRGLGKKSTGRSLPLRWTLGGLLGAMLILSLAFLLFRQQQQEAAQLRFQRSSEAQQYALTQATRSSGQVQLMSTLLAQLGEELDRSSQRTLSDASIIRIAALSQSLQPYRYLVGDSLSVEALSPERGQLLTALAGLRIDSSTFELIKYRVSFAGADLTKAQLMGLDLSRANLRGASFKEADLRRTQLSRADLRGANFWGVRGDEANFSRANMKRAHLQWGSFDGANFNRAQLDGADLTAAKLRKTDFKAADIKWAVLGAAAFDEADFTGSRLFWSDLSRASLSKAQLNNADIRRVNLSDAILTEADLTEALLDKIEVIESDWLDQLKTWKVKGITNIHQHYKLVKNPYGVPEFKLAVLR